MLSHYTDVLEILSKIYILQWKWQKNWPFIKKNWKLIRKIYKMILKFEFKIFLGKKVITKKLDHCMFVKWNCSRDFFYDFVVKNKIFLYPSETDIFPFLVFFPENVKCQFTPKYFQKSFSGLFPSFSESFLSLTERLGISFWCCKNASVNFFLMAKYLLLIVERIFMFTNQFQWVLLKNNIACK